MSRKNRTKKNIKELKELKENVDLSEDIIHNLNISENIQPIEKIKEEKSKFDIKIEAVAKAIQSPEGKKLALRVKVYNGVCHIYQGLFKNVWGRINPNGSHTIYRHALTNMLRKHPETQDLF